MAETDVAPEQPERGERNNEPIVYDESLLIIVKGKVQQPKQPDQTESRLLIQKLQAEITKRGDRIKEIKTLEEQLRGNAKEASSGNRDVISKLKELRDQRGTIIRQKAAIRDELNNCDGAREALRTEMRTIRDKNRNINPDKIEQDIRDLEFKLAHESLPEQEEKRAHTQLQQLTAAKPLAKKYAELDARLKETEAQRSSIIARLKESDGVIAQLDTQITAASSTLDEAKARADNLAADLPSLQVEKKENYEIMVALRAKIDELRKANDQEYQEYIKRDRAYRGWKREDGRKKYEARQKAREERDRERSDESKAILGDIVAEPFSGEIFTCDQMLTYLRSFTAVKEEVKEEVKQVEVPAGLKPFKRQEVVDEMFTGVPKKAPVSKGKAAPAPPKPVEPAKPKVQKLNHTLDMLKTFLLLQVEPPTTTSAIPATIEKVEARKEEYKQKQEEAKRAPPPRAARVEANGSHESAGKEVEVEDEPEAEAPAAAEEDEAESAPAEEEPEAPAAPAAEEEESTAAAKEEEPSAAVKEEEPSAAPAEEEKPSAAPEKADEAAEEEPSSSSAPEAGKDEAAEEEPAKAEEAEAPKAEGDGVGVHLTVEGNKVSVSVTAS